MEDEEVAMVDGVFEGAFGALGDKTWFGNESSSGCHGGLWWLIMDEEEDEVVRTKIPFVCEDGLAIEWNSENLTELLERKSDEFVLKHEGDKNNSGGISLKSDLTIKV
ncbi:hypothetical protein Tco_0805231 [Tanacetum coccineum]